MKDLLNQIETLTTSFMKDASSQLDKGNKAAGLRARRASLELEPLVPQTVTGGCSLRQKTRLASGCSGRDIHYPLIIAASILLPFQIIGQFLCYPGISVREHGDSLF